MAQVSSVVKKVMKRVKDVKEVKDVSEFSTLTCGDCAENHKGMQKIGDMVEHGYNVVELHEIKERMEAIGTECELINLADDEKFPEAHVLVMRNGVNMILKKMSDDMAQPIVKTQTDMFLEQKGLEHDKKAFMYGRVVNKHARWNLCFDETSQEPDYENKKGRIVGYSEVPLLKEFLAQFPKYFGAKGSGLKVESNYYYDTKTTGIGFHGDTERKIVIALRIGYASTPMHFQWYQNNQPVGDAKIIPLTAGDMYIMCEKATGNDWHKRKVLTLRHATGCKKFVGAF
jgi:hypothetical protein